MTFAPDTLTLVADIGGTNTRVALAEGRRVLTETIARYPNAQYPGLTEVLQTYIADHENVDPAAACVAVAGPVRDGAAHLTNLPWSINRETLAEATRAETVAILNDLQAQGHAIGHVAPESLKTVIAAPDAPATAAKLVIGVGTGFNAAPVYDTAEGRLVTPAEAGHANMTVLDDTDLRLSRYIETLHGFAAIEELLSGRGLGQIYSWLAREADMPEDLTAHQILERCREGGNPRAVEAVRVFVRHLGVVAGNLTLNYLPFGGIYLVGGMAQALAPWLEEMGFAEAFRDKGRFEPFLRGFGVTVVTDDYAALTGSAAHVASLIERGLDGG